MPAARLDLRHDLSLRLLAAFVVGALILCLIVLLAGAVKSPASGVEAPRRATAGDAVALPVGDVVREASELIVYRCEQAGRVTYTDQPCPGAITRTLRLPPA